jgi:MFS family permease
VTPALRRKWLFASLYFSEGAPIGFLWWALPTRLRAEGVEAAAIAPLLGLLVLPWALKFLWAPVVDIVRTPRWPLRAWIAAAQLLMGGALLATLLLDWQADYGLLAGLLILHAIAAATQDVAVDAYAIAVVRPDERGSINAWMQAGMLTGRSIFGGGALLLESRIGSPATVLLLTAAIWSSLAVLLVARVPEGRASAGTALPGATRGGLLAARRQIVLSRLGDILRRRTTWLVIGFAAIGGAGYEAVGLLVGPYLLDLGFTSEAIGGFLFLPTVAAMIAGAIAAGTAADRVDRRHAAGLTLILMALTIWALAQASGGGAMTLVLLALLYFLIGAFTTASYALFMDRTDPRLGATQLSTYMSATNLCESWSAFAVGKLVAVSGYGPAFSTMALLSLLGLPLLWTLPRGAADRPVASDAPE